MGKPEFTGCDLIQWEWEIMGKPEFMGCDLLQQEIMGKPESTGCDLIQWEIMGKYIYQLGFTGAIQFRDGTLHLTLLRSSASNVRVKCPISELGATVKYHN